MLAVQVSVVLQPVWKALKNAQRREMTYRQNKGFTSWQLVMLMAIMATLTFVATFGPALIKRQPLLTSFTLAEADAFQMTPTRVTVELGDFRVATTDKTDNPRLQRVTVYRHAEGVNPADTYIVGSVSVNEHFEMGQPVHLLKVFYSKSGPNDQYFRAVRSKR